MSVSVRELRALGFEFAPQFDEIFDDAVMDDREPVRGVRMRVVFGRPAVGRPAGVADADGAQQWFAGQPLFQISKLALRPPARELALFEGGDAG